MRWAAAKEATSIEIKFAKQRLTLWKREVHTQVQNTTAKAHAWSKAPQTWVPARAEHQGRGVVAHAQRLQEDLDVWKQVWEHTDGAASFCEKIHDFGDEEPPPKLTPQDVRAAARTFSCNRRISNQYCFNYYCNIYYVFISEHIRLNLLIRKLECVKIN